MIIDNYNEYIAFQLSHQNSNLKQSVRQEFQTFSNKQQPYWPNIISIRRAGLEASLMATCYD